MASITTNIMAYQAQVNLAKVNASMGTVMQRLSSGYKINSAGDDPAGLAISNRMTAQIKGYEMAASHASDAMAMLQTVEGALTEIDRLMQRMRELSVQASSETFNANDRSAADAEYQQLEAEISRIVTDTKWNTMSVLDGTGGKTTTGTFIIQVGADSGMTISVKVGTVGIIKAGTLIAMSAANVLTQVQAALTTAKIDSAINTLNVKRADVGSYLNRLQGALDNALSMAQNLTDSRSRILDTDYAEELAKLARLQIIQQAGNAMLAQANAQPQGVLALLQ